MVAPKTEIIISKDGVELERHLAEPGQYIIGRGADCELRISGGKVSRHHARLFVGLQHWSITDLGSANGTLLDEHLIGPDAVVVLPSQKIQIGDTIIELRTFMPDDASPALAQGPLREDLPPELQGPHRYQIGNQVAQAGMGAILDALEVSTQRNVAMRVVPRAADLGNVQRFIEEARITAQLEHPGIAPIYELGVNEQGEVFSTTKMVQGIAVKKVTELLAKGVEGAMKKYPLPVRLTIFQKACDAAAFAHSKGVIHCDLKPENIVLGNFGEVSVMGWGHARRVGGTERPAGGITDQPACMSPEQARGGIEKLDARSDIYALGAILFELLHLRPAVTGADAAQIIGKVRAGAIEWGAGETQIPAALLAICRKALALSIEDRYPRVEEMQADLLAFQNGFVASTEKVATIATPPSAVAEQPVPGAAAKTTAPTGTAPGAVAKAPFPGGTAPGTVAKAPFPGGTAPGTVAKAPFPGGTPPGTVAKAPFPGGTPPGTVAKAPFPGGTAPGTVAKAPVPGGAQLSPIETSPAPAAKRGKFAIIIVVLLLVGVGAVFTFKALSPPDRAKPAPAKSTQTQGRTTESISPGKPPVPAARVAEDAIRLAFRAWEKLPGWEKTENRLAREADDTFALLLGDLPIQDLSPLLPLRDLPISKVVLHHTPATNLTPLAALPLRELDISDSAVTDLAGLRGLKLKKLGINGSKVHSLDHLQGMPLVELDASGLPELADLGPLKGMPLESLNLEKSTGITFLEPLQGMPLKKLNLGQLSIRNIQPLREIPLESAEIAGPFQDLEPLKGAPLKFLKVDGGLTDLSALRGSSVENLMLHGCDLIKDFTPLLECARLNQLSISPKSSGVEKLRAHPALKQLGTGEQPRPVAEFLDEWEAQHPATPK